MRQKVRTFHDYRDNDFAAKATGTISIARSGVGFVAPENGGTDILIPERDIGGALPGDRVEVRLAPPDKGDRRLKGRVTRVLERCARDIVCTLRRTGRFWTAIPLTPFGGRTFNVREPGTARDGDRVIIRFREWANPTLNPDATLVSVIGPEEKASLDTLAIEKAYGLDPEFPPAVMAEAQSAPSRLKEPGDRLDLRKETIITIDPDTAKDYDDALSLSTDKDGNTVLGVHIADVSWFVRPGSAIDREARRRGTSVYLVDQVVPMLPEQLCNGVCSLVEGEDRLAFSAFLTFTPSGAMVSRRFARSIIRSAARLTYGEALGMIEHPEKPVTGPHAAVAGLVRSLHELSQKLRKARFDRFSLDLASPELEIRLDKEGRMIGIAPAEHNVAHELVEEAMIAANEAVATEVALHKVPHLCRFHDVPAEEKLEELEASLADLGLRTGSLGDARELSRLLKAIRGTPLEYYVSMQVLRSMKRAEYSVDNEGHFGLAKRFYSHFTSPIRRYPDLVMHRQLALVLSGDRKAQPSRDELRSIARVGTETEMNADLAERALIEIKKYRFLEAQLAAGKPMEYEAVVVAVKEFGVFIEVQDLSVGGMVHVSTLSDKFLRYDESRGRLTAPGIEIAVGSRLKVLVSAVDFDQRRIDWSVTEIPRQARKVRVEANETLKNAKTRRAEARREKRAPEKKGKKAKKGRR